MCLYAAEAIAYGSGMVDNMIAQVSDRPDILGFYKNRGYSDFNPKQSTLVSSALTK